MLAQGLPVLDGADRSLAAGRGLHDPAFLKGTVSYQHFRGGEPISDHVTLNGITGPAKNAILDAWFNAGTRASTWSVGLVDGSTYSSFQSADTMASHAGWAELTDYTYSGSGSARGSWGKGAASAQAITNSSPVVFDFTGFGGTKSVHGVFVVSDGTKGGTVGVLWSTAAFLAPLTVESGDQLRVTYTVQL